MKWKKKKQNFNKKAREINHKSREYGLNHK